MLLIISISIRIDQSSFVEADTLTEFDLQQGKEPLASSIQNDEHAADHAIDSDPSTRWAADGSDKPQWLQIDLGQSYDIHSILTSFEFADSYYRYKIEISEDDENWDVFIDKTDNTDPPSLNGYLDEGEVNGRYVRITVTDTQHFNMWASIREFRINPQLQTMAIASSEQITGIPGEKQAENAIDNDKSTLWAADGDSKPQWLMIDYGVSKHITNIRTQFEFVDSYYQYKIEISDDKEEWLMFADKTDNEAPSGEEGYLNTGSLVGRYVRITVTNTQHPDMWAAIREVQLNSTEKNDPLPTADDVKNVAVGKKVVASSTMSDEFSPTQAVDGIVGSTRWSAANNDEPHWLMVDLQEIYYITGTKTFFEFDDAAYEYLIETSEDGEVWNVFADQKDNENIPQLGFIDSGGVSARFVRITISGEMWASIQEFKVFGTKNLAQSKAVSVSSEQDEDHSGKMAVDGDRYTTRWAADGNEKPQWLEVDLGKKHEIERIETYFENTDVYYQYIIEVSNDRENWRVFTDRSQNEISGNPGYTDIGHDNGRYIRVRITNTETEPMWVSIREIRIFGSEQVESLPDMALTSNNYQLRVESNSSDRYGIGIYKSDERIYYNNKPQQLIIKNVLGNQNIYHGAYDDVQLFEDALVFTGKVGTDYGSIITFKDTYRVSSYSGTFELEREVEVEKAVEEDIGYNTVFSLIPQVGENIEQYEMLAPGNWYKDNSNVVERSFASDYNDEYFYIREMRLPLPFFMMRNEVTGETLSLGRGNANPKSDLTENNGDWLVDPSFTYGSLGIHKLAQPSLNFVYPAMEGEINYINHDNPWVNRSHPVDSEGSQNYELIFRFDNQSEYEEALQEEWRTYFEILDPPVKHINVNNLYNNAIDLLDLYSQEYNGVMGLPFKVDIPDGEVSGNAMVMGFVGQQLPAAYQMIRYGLEQDNQQMVYKGSEMVDFWVQHSMTPTGLPKTWYEPYFEETGVFTNRDVDLRTMSDGMEGALDAYRIMKNHDQSKDDWLEYLQIFGDWLVENQNDDGSYYRIYDLEGNPVHLGIFNTTNPIRFLLELYKLTNEINYKDAAIKAGNFAYENIYQPFMFVGGTSDNDNTIDKEAGAMAMNAFLALYDETKEERWLDALKGAADYTATWTFAWSYDTPPAGTRWAADGDSKPQWLQVDLGQAYDISEVQTYMEYPDMAYQYNIEISLDGSNWTSYVDRSTNTESGNPAYVDKVSANTRYVRITINGTEEPGAWVSMWEFKVLDEDGNNLALGKETTASSSTQPPKNATDGNIHTNKTSPFPESGLIGQSLVSTGHSYVDTYMAYLGATYYRLYLYTDDPIYLHFAKLLQHNANYTADWKGEWGYAHPGLVEEGGNVTELEYSGIGVWLLWNTIAQLEPLSDLEDRFGSFSIEEIEQLPLDERKRLNGSMETERED